MVKAEISSLERFCEVGESFPPVMEIRSICLMSEIWILDKYCSGIFEKVVVSSCREEFSNWQAVSVRNKNSRRNGMKKKRGKFLKTPADIFCMEDHSFCIMREKYHCLLRFLYFQNFSPQCGQREGIRRLLPGSRTHRICFFTHRS